MAFPAFLEAVQELGLVDRRRLVANVAAVRWAFSAAASSDALDRAGFVASVVLYLCSLLRNDLDPVVKGPRAPKGNEPQLPPAMSKRRRSSLALTPAQVIGLDSIPGVTAKPEESASKSRGEKLPDVSSFVEINH